MKEPFNAFIGRFQSPHKGHMTLFNKYLSEYKPILIMIRDIPTDDKNPLSSNTVLLLWETIYYKEIVKGLVKVIIIPDIASINYGRGVGYEVVEIKVDDKISSISATDIRSKIKSKDDSWKEFVDSSIHDKLTNLLG